MYTSIFCAGIPVPPSAATLRRLRSMGQAIPRCHGGTKNECCASKSQGTDWPSRGFFAESYDHGSIVRNGPTGYTCVVLRNGCAFKRVCEITIRNLRLKLYDTKVDTCAMYKESLFPLQHDNILRCYDFFQTESFIVQSTNTVKAGRFWTSWRIGSGRCALGASQWASTSRG
jgi:hypothetical protein